MPPSWNNNTKGKNQHREEPYFDSNPELPVWIQEYVNQGVKIKGLPQMLLEDHKLDISYRSVQRIIQKQGIHTARKSGLSAVEKGAAILDITEEDHLNRWGCRRIQEKLALRGEHLTRDFISEFRRADDSQATAARHPRTRKVHHHGLWSSGPNEEWCVDGHEKLLQAMGIAVWGIADKYSRVEVNLKVVPNARNNKVPPTIYLLTARERGGIPLTTTSDMGTEVGLLIALQTTLRQQYLPLDVDLIPPHKSVKSTYNITRERGWRPIHEHELSNICHAYKTGKIAAGFHEGDEIHEGVARWLWAKVVQRRLDNIVQESRFHRVRKQKDSLLPTGGRHIDFYEKPHNWGGKNQLIEIPQAELDRLIADHASPEVLQFGSDEMVKMCEGLFEVVGSPQVSSTNGWNVFTAMMEVFASGTGTDSDRA